MQLWLLELIAFYRRSEHLRQGDIPGFLMSNEELYMPVIGLTGGVGAGKSAAAAAFGDLGFTVIDADAVGHQLLQDRDVVDEICDLLGKRHLRVDGSIDRASLAAVVFSDTDSLRKLESVLHPRMKKVFEAKIREAENTGVSGVVLDAAVLFEAGWDSICSDLVFVDAPRELRLSRLLLARGWDEEELRRRESSQNPLDKKMERCSYTICNNSDNSHLIDLVGKIFKQISMKG